MYKIVDEDHPRFGQIGKYDRRWIIPNSKPDLYCHTIKFEDGKTEQFLSYQIEKVALLECEDCHKTSPSVHERGCAYYEDVNDDFDYRHTVCDDCEYDHAMEI